MTQDRLQSRLISLSLSVIIALGAGSAHAKSATEIRTIIVEEATGTDVPTSLAMAVAMVGANFRPDHQGPKGARGVMQIMPEMAESMGVTPATLWKPRRNIRLGLRILSNILDRTEGNWIKAIATYHSDRLKPASRPMRQRVAKILKWERRFAEQLALQNPPESRRRDVLAGHDSWDNEPPTPSQSAPTDEWSDVERETVVEDNNLAHRFEDKGPVQVIIIERVETHPFIDQMPPPPFRWLNNHPRGGARWYFPNRPERLRRHFRAERRPHRMTRWHPRAKRQQHRMKRRIARRMMRRHQR